MLSLNVLRSFCFFVFVAFLFSGCDRGWSDPESVVTSQGDSREENSQDDTFLERLKKLDIPETFQLPEIVIGDKQAKNTLIVYSSFSCSHCLKFHTNEWPILKKEMVDTGKLKVYLRNYVDDMAALESAMLFRAFGQAKGENPEVYERMYKVLFDRQAEWMKSSNPREFLKKIFVDDGFEREKVEECLSSQSKIYTKIAAGLMRDQKKALGAWNIEIVPAFVINGQAHCGFLTAKEIMEKFSSK